MIAPGAEGPDWLRASWIQEALPISFPPIYWIIAAHCTQPVDGAENKHTLSYVASASGMQ